MVGTYGNNPDDIPPAVLEHLSWVRADRPDSGNVFLATGFSVSFCGTDVGHAQRHPSPDGVPRTRKMINMKEEDLGPLAAIHLHVTAINFNLNADAQGHRPPGWEARVQREAAGLKRSALKIRRPEDGVADSEIGTAKLNDAVTHINDIRGRLGGDHAALADSREMLGDAELYLNVTIDARIERAREIVVAGPDAPPNLAAKFSILRATEVAMENFPPDRQPLDGPLIMAEAAACGVLALVDERRPGRAYEGRWFANVVVPSYQMWASTLRNHYIHCGENGSFLVHIGHGLWAYRPVGPAALDEMRARHRTFREFFGVDRMNKRTHIIAVMLQVFQPRVRAAGLAANGAPQQEALPTARKILDEVRQLDVPGIQEQWSHVDLHDPEVFVFEGRVGEAAYLQFISRTFWREAGRPEAHRILRIGEADEGRIMQVRHDARFGLTYWWAGHQHHDRYFLHPA